MAALEAFQLACPLPHLPATYGRECNDHPLSEQVALLIKTFPPQGFSAEWHWLQARAAEDSRIVLIAESLPREESLALYGCCDVHRSEGFGRGMAEALQLGVDVIATDFGGNTDFCSGPLALPVRWRSAPIPRGAYPYADGHSWAEPDLEHAVELCRQVAARRLAMARHPFAADPSRDPAVLAGYRERFSFASVGARYRARLDELWGCERSTRDSTDASHLVLVCHRLIGLVRSRYGDFIRSSLGTVRSTAAPLAGSPGLVNAFGGRTTAPDFIHHQLRRCQSPPLLQPPGR